MRHSNISATRGISRGAPDDLSGEGDLDVAEREDVVLAQHGDEAAFERLYRRHFPRVSRSAAWLMADADVDDVVQEVFIRVWRKLPTFAGRAPFGAWLNRVALHVILRHRRRRGHRREREAPGAPADRSSGGGLADVALAFEDAVGALPARAREVFVMYDLNGIHHDEIAVHLGIAPETSRSQLHRARMLLRRHLCEDAPR